MRIIISLLLLSYSVSAMSQRVYFEDPDLTFSFKKPKSWTIFDNGYVVKVTPDVQDSAFTYLTITYFESAQSQSLEESGLIMPPSNSSPKNTYDSHTQNKKHLKVVKDEVDWERSLHSKDGQHIEKRFYAFNRIGLSWEIVASTREDQFPKLEKKFERMIRSLRIENRKP